MARQIAAINRTCGRPAVARAEWRRLARALEDEGAPMNLAIADEARRRLGAARTADQRRRLERALDTTSRTLDSGETSNPGYTELARASLLAALGRVDEARQSMARVFLFPDRNLSHALAHSFMRGPTAEIPR
jgi:hypothetical protein